MNFTNYSFTQSLILIYAVIGLWHGLPVSGKIVLDTEESLPRCPINDPVETGRIQEAELVEASGLVASHRHPGVYYSIQDSQNPDNVYAMKYNGETIGTNA
jgi:hypothetical protein